MNEVTTKRRGLLTILTLGAALASCTVPNPTKRYRDGGVDASVDAPIGNSCAANEALRCKDTDLVLYSLIATCDLHGTDPIEYLKDVLLRVDFHPAADIDSILPHRWTPPARVTVVENAA